MSSNIKLLAFLQVSLLGWWIFLSLSTVRTQRNMTIIMTVILEYFNVLLNKDGLFNWGGVICLCVTQHRRCVNAVNIIDRRVDNINIVVCFVCYCSLVDVCPINLLMNPSYPWYSALYCNTRCSPRNRIIHETCMALGYQ